MTFFNISVRPGDHAPFLETHGNSVRLGRFDDRIFRMALTNMVVAVLNPTATIFHRQIFHRQIFQDSAEKYGDGRDIIGQTRAVDNALTLSRVWPFKNVGAILGHANAAAYADNMHGCGKF